MSFSSLEQFSYLSDTPSKTYFDPFYSHYLPPRRAYTNSLFVSMCNTSNQPIKTQCFSHWFSDNTVRQTSLANRTPRRFKLASAKRTYWMRIDNSSERTSKSDSLLFEQISTILRDHGFFVVTSMQGSPSKDYYQSELIQPAPLWHASCTSVVEGACQVATEGPVTVALKLRIG